jgi:hypothetical protein
LTPHRRHYPPAMTGRTLFILTFLAFLALAACQNAETVGSAAATPDVSGWRLASGKLPTMAEFAALAATCQDQSKDGSLDSCLNELGLKRAQ